MDRAWGRAAAVPLAVSAALVAAGLLVRLLVPAPLEPTGRTPLALRLLDVNRERNIPTAWSVGLLLACAGAALRLAVRERGSGWALLAAVPTAMALDEAVQVHERADALGRVLTGDALHFAWVVPGALVVALVAVAVRRPLQALPAVVRRRLGLAAGLHLVGALLVEAVSGVVLDLLGRGAVYAVANALEEGLEMAGASLALAALLLAAVRHRPAAPPAAVPGRR